MKTGTEVDNMSWKINAYILFHSPLMELTCQSHPYHKNNSYKLPLNNDFSFHYNNCKY